VGFGVRSAKQAEAIAEIADGVVVGTALVTAVANSLSKAGKATAKTTRAVHSLVGEIASGLRS
jgi:tryptophan synthase alpha chain